MAQTSVDFADSKPCGVYLGPRLPDKQIQPEKKKVTPIVEYQTQVANSREVSQ